MPQLSPRPGAYGRRQLTAANRRVVLGIQLLALVGLVVGGIWGTASGWHTRSLQQPVRGWVATTGQVVAVHDKTYRSTVYSPVIAFTDAHGDRHQFAAAYSSFQAHVGDSAQVDYDPSDPARAHDLSNDEVSWRGAFVTGIWLLCVGGIGWIVVLAVAVHRIRATRRV